MNHQAPERVHLVAFGTAVHTTLPSLDSVTRNVQALVGVLKDPDILGIEPGNLTSVLNPVRPEDVLDPLSAVAEAAEDTLIIYYAGHGLLNRKAELFLSLRDSQPGKAYTALQYAWLRDAAIDSPARRKIIILDCCFSGRALGGAMSSEDAFADQSEVQGTYVLTATAENVAALAPPEDAHTVFTGELLDLLRSGIANAGDRLSLDDVFRHLRQRLLTRQMPQPQVRDRNDVGSLRLFRNRAVSRARPPTIAGEAGPARRELYLQARRSSLMYWRRKPWLRSAKALIRRDLERDVAQALARLRPVNLQRATRESRHTTGDGQTISNTVYRSVPDQVITISDQPGSGRSTFAAGLSRSQADIVTVLWDARDEVLEAVTHLFGQLHQGRTLADPAKASRWLSILRAAGQALVLVVDDLDVVRRKSADEIVLGLMRHLEALNAFARAEGLLAYPLALVFVTADSGWERWFRLIEGRQALSFRNRLAHFSPEEFDSALAAYGSAYGFQLVGTLPAPAREALTAPGALHLFAEGHDSAGLVPVTDITPDNVYEPYLDVLIDQMTFQYEMDGARDYLTALATMMLSEERHAVPRSRAKAEEPRRFYAGLVEENVLIGGRDGYVTFRHPDLATYLLARSALGSVLKGAPLQSQLEATVARTDSSVLPSVLTKLTRMAPPGSVSSLRILEAVYSTAGLGERLLALRVAIGSGEIPEQSELATIAARHARFNASDAWNAFFILAAKPSAQPHPVILAAFRTTWLRNEGRTDRWKLILKLADRDLLDNPHVLALIAEHGTPRELETLLGLFLEQQEAGKDVSQAANRLRDQGLPLRLRSALSSDQAPAWEHAETLLSKLEA